MTASNLDTYEPGELVPVGMTVNGVSVKAEVPARTLLSDFLRHHLRLTGTHVGCEHGVCGACTVHIDGRAARACITLAPQVDGCEVLTVEGLAGPDGALHPVQEAFASSHALQCGFCTPGFMMAITAMINENPGEDWSDEEIRERIAGNLCRCTGYQNIVKAVRRVLRPSNDTSTGEE